jgi:hypothetical protein
MDFAIGLLIINEYDKIIPIHTFLAKSNERYRLALARQR